MFRKALYNLFIAMFFFSCNEEKVASVAEYSKWLNNPDNGLVVVRRVNGLKLSVKYLPADFLKYKDMQGDEAEQKELKEMNDKYKNTLTFLMTVGPDEEKGNTADIMMSDISNYKEYAERLLTMNFELDRNITLRAGNIELKPVLSALENTYGLSKNRSVVLAFAPTDEEKAAIDNASVIDFSYSDELFAMGILHFEFSENKLHRLPYISELKNR